MEFHEKSLELNVTHELLNLADSWYWFLTDIPLWRYWRPRYHLPFLKYPKSTSGGFHITTEGQNDPTGNAGGGYDVRIKTGIGNHLLFIQYKKGEFITTSPDPKSIFHTTPHDHFKFKINSTSTNQHFVLRDLANGIGNQQGNAVVYAFPLIKDMADLEANAGKLIRKTKFISIVDIDDQAKNQKPPVAFKKGQEHNFRVSKFDMNKCEVNFFFFFFFGEDRTSQIIADIIAVRFQKTLSYFLKVVEDNYKKYDLYEGYIPYGLEQSFIQYIRYLLHYFETSPTKLQVSYINKYAAFFSDDEFIAYESLPRDVEILNSVFSALSNFEKFISSLNSNTQKILSKEIPNYTPKFLIPSNGENGMRIKFEEQTPKEVIEAITYLAV